MKAPWAGPQAGGGERCFPWQKCFDSCGSWELAEQVELRAVEELGQEQWYHGRAEPAPAASRSVFHLPKLPLRPPLLTLRLPPAFPSALHAECTDGRASAVGGCGATGGTVGVALNR